MDIAVDVIWVTSTPAKSTLLPPKNIEPFDAAPVNELNEEEIAANCTWLNIIKMPVIISAITIKFSSFFTEILIF